MAQGTRHTVIGVDHGIKRLAPLTCDKDRCVDLTEHKRGTPRFSLSRGDLTFRSSCDCGLRKLSRHVYQG